MGGCDDCFFPEDKIADYEEASALFFGTDLYDHVSLAKSSTQYKEPLTRETYYATSLWGDYGGEDHNPSLANEGYHDPASLIFNANEHEGHERDDGGEEQDGAEESGGSMSLEGEEASSNEEGSDVDQ